MNLPPFLFAYDAAVTGKDAPAYVIHTGIPQFIGRVIETEGPEGGRNLVLKIDHFTQVNPNDPRIRRLESTALEYAQRAMNN